MLLCEEFIRQNKLFKNGEIILKTIYIPKTIFTYFFIFPFGSSISNILAIITAITIPSIQLLKNFIIYTSSHYSKSLQLKWSL